MVRVIAFVLSLNTLVGALEVVARRSARFDDGVEVTAADAHCLLPLSLHNLHQVRNLGRRYISIAEAIEDYNLFLSQFAAASKGRGWGR
jgi:hypothetical protein